jgi:hypothetical protein
VKSISSNEVIAANMFGSRRRNSESASACVVMGSHSEWIRSGLPPVDFVRSDVQVALRIGRQPVCTPRLLAKHGVGNTRQDLERYHLLHSKSEPWRGWPGGALEEEIFMGDEWGRAAQPAMIQLRSYTQPKQARASRWHVGVW